MIPLLWHAEPRSSIVVRMGVCKQASAFAGMGSDSDSDSDGGAPVAKVAVAAPAKVIAVCCDTSESGAPSC